MCLRYRKDCVLSLEDTCFPIKRRHQKNHLLVRLVNIKIWRYWPELQCNNYVYYTGGYSTGIQFWIYNSHGTANQTQKSIPRWNMVLRLLHNWTNFIVWKPKMMLQLGYMLLCRYGFHKSQRTYISSLKFKMHKKKCEQLKEGLSNANKESHDVFQTMTD